MKQLTVVVFCLLSTFVFSDWQQKEKVDLPKGVHITDLTVDDAGDVWLLTSSSILKLDAQNRNPILVAEARDGRMIAVRDHLIYEADIQNRISRFDSSQDYGVNDLGITLNASNDLTVVAANKEPVIAVLEQRRVRFVAEDKSSYFVNADAEQLAVIPGADYGGSTSLFYTLSHNRIMDWTGGTYREPERYQSRLIYSASTNIIDIAAGSDGGLFILFADSVVVLDEKGEYKTRIGIENMPPGSVVFSNPVSSGLVLFNPLEKILLFYNETRKIADDIIILNRNHPNPVDNYTEIEFKLNQSLEATMTVYNLIGEPVKVVTRGYFSRGTHRAVWHAEDEQGNLVPNGVYFYRLETKKGVAIRQLTVLR